MLARCCEGTRLLALAGLSLNESFSMRILGDAAMLERVLFSPDNDSNSEEGS